MHKSFENEDWLSREASQVVQKQLQQPMSDWEELVVCVFESSYLAEGHRMNPLIKAEGLLCAERLELPETIAAFSATDSQFLETFTSRFDRICDELQSVCPAKKL